MCMSRGRVGPWVLTVGASDGDSRGILDRSLPAPSPLVDTVSNNVPRKTAADRSAHQRAISKRWIWARESVGRRQRGQMTLLWREALTSN